MPRPHFTICIPAYNRANLLPPLLDSILSQDFDDYQILICEDKSPERLQIKSVVDQYNGWYPDRIIYRENERNLGYDGNIRQLVALSTGQYCVFMGNDDLMYPHALHNIADAINRTPECGAVIRSYASFEGDPSVFKQIFRYFPIERIFNPGVQAITMTYRRSVVISGMVIRRDDAQALSTTQFDGSLLYQLYLTGMIATSRPIVFTPEIIALRRDGNLPDFGNSESERGHHTPHDVPPSASIHFMKSMLNIAQYIETTTGKPVFRAIRSDIGYYSYPVLSIQAHRPRFTFIKYGLALARLGFWRYLLYYVYFIGLLLLGPHYCDRIIYFIKTRIGSTPQFGVVRKVTS